jgi:hypothetical protein
MDDSPDHFSQTCVCGREFYHLNAFSHHINNCQSKKKRMAAVIEAAQELYRKKKQHRFQATQSNPFENVASNSSNLLLPEPSGGSGGTIAVCDTSTTVSCGRY